MITFLSDMRAKLPVGARIELEAEGRSLGTFEVAHVNSAVGDEDKKVFAAYRPVGRAEKGELLL